MSTLKPAYGRNVSLGAPAALLIVGSARVTKGNTMIRTLIGLIVRSPAPPSHSPLMRTWSRITTSMKAPENCCAIPAATSFTVRLKGRVM